MKKGLEVFEMFFGERPVGCWPSEGGISDDTAKLIESHGFQWIATGENVIRNSINNSASLPDDMTVFHAFKQGGTDIQLYGRDDTLSDLIGFTYADWHADDAVGDLVNRLEDIAEHYDNKSNMVVSIIMDGENAWEYYPENGYHFLSTLYERIASSKKLELHTYKELSEIKPVQIETITSGSWVYGTFSTWIGDEDKNRGWDILGDVKMIYDQVIAKTDISPEARDRLDIQLAICEGSDWFWWFGDYNPASTVSDFEHLYRIQITNLYHLLGHEPPQYLSQTLSHGSGNPDLGGVIRPGTRE
jgi:alpha-amylase/alpha-mannosidase (GH57 family)